MSGAPTARLFPAGLWNVGLRYLLRHRWQSALMVLGIALGVGVMVAIDLANASARQAFALSTQALTGKATHELNGGPQGIPQSVYVDLARRQLAPAAAPVISELVSSPQLGSQPLQLLGIDPFVDGAFRDYLGSGPSISYTSLADFLTRPGAVLLARSTAERYGLSLGQAFTLSVQGHSQPVFLAGEVEGGDALAQRTLDGLVLADISTAQELTGRTGRLDWIDLILPDGVPPALQAWLPSGVTLQAAAARQGSVQQMTAAFQLNLSALSMLALVVGLFLIYNTMTFSVVQRRELFGTLRCLGVTRREIFGLVACEALAVGLVGSLAGVGLGLLFGRDTIGMVSQTINDLYFTTTVRAVGLPVESLIKGGVIGLAATLLTSVFPAWEAASVPPRLALHRSGLESKARRAVAVVSGLGLLLIGLGIVCFRLPDASLFLGFGGTAAVVVGFAMLSAAGLVLLLRAVTPLSGRLLGLLGRMAPRALLAALSRTGVAVAALMVAIAVTIGVSLMIDSFRYTVTIWLAQTLQGDIYISVPGETATTALVTIDSGVVDTLRSWPGVRRVDTLRTTMIQSPAGPIQLSATDNPDFGNERVFMQLNVPQPEVLAQMQAGGVLVSEPLANRLGLFAPGSVVSLFTPVGLREFPVVGIYYDYASSEGAMYMAMSFYRQVWTDAGITAISLRLAPGYDPDGVTRQLQDQFSGGQMLEIRPNLALRADVMQIFDRTFAITAALRLLATGVAFIGVLNTLLLLQLEKQRESGILRALGLTGRQLWGLTLLETGLMGLAAGLLAMPTGYVLSLILVYVINLRSFGWTLQMMVTPQAFLQGLAVSVGAALLAGIYPAWRIGRKQAAEAIREE